MTPAIIASGNGADQITAATVTWLLQSGVISVASSKEFYLVFQIKWLIIRLVLQLRDKVVDWAEPRTAGDHRSFGISSFHFIAKRRINFS